MRDTPYELRAAKQTVSLTLNSDLYAKAKAGGLSHAIGVGAHLHHIAVLYRA